MANVNRRRDPAVYALHAGDHHYFYVGETSVNSDNRLYQHISRAQKGHNAPVYQRMRDVGIRNVVVTDLEANPDAGARADLEAEWIARLLELGHPIVNVLGRDGVANSIPDDMRMRMGASRRGKPTWIKGKRGEDAGWTDERREAITDRAALARAARAPRHGTLNEFNKYGCRCVECFAAARSPRVPVEAHGRYLYKRDKCRCPVCVEANREYGRKWQAARAVIDV